MHIDFAPPSNGAYNNAGSSRQLANYMEHEDLERMEKGIYTEGFFNLTDDNIYKSKVIKDIDTNIGQLLKTDAKFFAIHVSPSESELRVMGNTEQEQAEAMKRYIREVFISEYANNFNKGLSEADIKFYGKIHFNRSRSDNKLNMHCHLIVSRKDQVNKKKLSPLTNHKNTKKGTVTGGFDRVNLFKQAEQGFDKLFNYNRQQTESFDYYNTMKNSSISEQLEIQNQNFTGEKKKERFQSGEKENNISCNLDSKQDNKYSNNQQNNSGGDSLLSIFSLDDNNNYDVTLAEELQVQKRKKKKQRGIRR
ncbi:DUF5712 family protein [Bacteroides xylanisolvens]|uniref:DUF5712 family protein n=1 Tax=Bacteroides xylanisolvens TaxID=371601 RepID=UPI001C8BFB2B|nr:DUF5712 family protein [Bacteroides xylanisolvens]MBX9093623.1 clindamycin resistance transfer factor BtgB [Bacteroides xylanisolvens]MBX9167490.1 clindamycin resistance transfer factor BtgB [Bacteroides xylanisolvens]